MVSQQIAPYRIDHIEGVADREPYDSKERLSPSNLRISITLTGSDAVPPPDDASVIWTRPAQLSSETEQPPYRR